MAQTLRILPNLDSTKEKGPASTGIMEGECILWTGAGSKPSKKKKKPCGIIRRQDKWRKHIIGKTPAKHFWEEHHDQPVPKGMQVGHVCTNSLCINIKHLIVGTQSSLAYMWSAQGRLKKTPITHCKHGHAMKGNNIYISWSKNGTEERSCLKCRQRRARNLERKKFNRTPRPKREHPPMHILKPTPSDIRSFYVFVGKMYPKLPETTIEDLVALVDVLDKKCRRGHRFTKKNTLVYYNKTDDRWNRMCRLCANKRFRMVARKKKGFGAIRKYKKELLEKT